MSTHPTGGGVQTPDPNVDIEQDEGIVEFEDVPQEPQADPAQTLPGSTPVLERLRGAYADYDAEARRKTFEIVPGRYGGDLAFRAYPIDFEALQKKTMRAQRKGANPQAEMNFCASVIAEACETVLVRNSEGDMVPLSEEVNEFDSADPVRFDSRLAQVLGIPDGHGGSEVAICRLVFRNKQALTSTFRELLAWLGEETPDDEDEEDGAERPT